MAWQGAQLSSCAGPAKAAAKPFPALDRGSDRTFRPGFGDRFVLLLFTTTVPYGKNSFSDRSCLIHIQHLFLSSNLLRQLSHVS